MTHSVSSISLQERKLTLPEDGDAPSIDSRKHYKKALKSWQKKLLHVQQAYFHQGRRAILVFEGWDAAGKGGAIRRITEKLDPRGFRVHPFAQPTAEEQGKHYLYRFQTRLPAPGRLAIFDRSYYGRVLVERVEGFTPKPAWERAYQEINEFERLLIDDDVTIIKLFMHISDGEQLERFEERLNNPYKRWKLTEEDIRNRGRRKDYVTAIEEMFDKTDTTQAPWHLIHAEHKWHARISVLKTIVEALSEGVTVEPPPIDQELVHLAEKQLGITLE
ncbi:polyphosphate kinase [Alteromonas sp. 1_MG-2023]|uniref:polyphosphate kinase 2 family protein n=1 Tax=Alteromonas sp. 1_MG-2023 TaxID=3062669 RepID=UPI0026E2C4DD|nr:PPK2 family polyphosphate kinase [Alteromonas sp. 1_MG-2023]MDO6567257.1 polyphosphate kinase [Alteromonas sp. 1_MG-2023]